MENLKHKEWVTILKHYEERERKYVNNRDTVYFLDILAGCFNDNLDIIEDCKNRVIAFNNLINHVCSSNCYVNNKKNIDIKIKNALGLAKSEIRRGNHLFKNYFNELLFLDELLYSSTIEDINVDYVLPNGNDIDFVITDKNTSEKIGFEITTSQHFNAEKASTKEEIEKFIHNRITDKWNNKTDGLSEFEQLDNLYIVLFIEINSKMAETIFPTKDELDKRIILRSSAFFKSAEDDKPYYIIDEPSKIIERLKKDDSTFFE